ncbi:MAG: hypothetical protein RLP44_22230 [Aggregatilineales bacterium]
MMIFHQTIHFAGLWILLPFLIVMPVQQQNDDSLFSQDICHFPCWQNITPGQSTITDVMEVVVALDLEHSTFFKQSTYDLTEFSQPYLASERHTIWWWNDRPATQNVITLDDAIVRSIQIRETTNFTLEDILTAYGEPDESRLRYDYSVEVNWGTVFLSVFYYHLGLKVDFVLYRSRDVPETVKLEISSDAIGIGYTLYPATSARLNFSANMFGLSVDTIERQFTETYYRPGWHGLGYPLRLEYGQLYVRR